MDKSEQKRLVMNWSRNADLIESMQIESLRRDGPQNAILALADVNRIAISRHLPEPTSGLIEMQRLFTKLRKK